MLSAFEPFGRTESSQYDERVGGAARDRSDDDSSTSGDSLYEEELREVGCQQRLGRNRTPQVDEDVALGPNHPTSIVLDAPCYNSHIGADMRRAARLAARQEPQEEGGESTPSPHDVSLDSFLCFSRQLQEQEDKRERDERIAAAAREIEERRVRREKWNEVKARMTARSSYTPALSLRSAEWDSDGDYDDGVSHGNTGLGDDQASRRTSRTAVPMTSDPLLDADERPLSKLMKREKLPSSVRLWHRVYNWFRWSILAMYNMSDLAEDPSGYYQERQFE